LIPRARPFALDAGAAGITIHCEDRRHIQDRDSKRSRARCGVLNLEMALTDESDRHAIDATGVRRSCGAPS
jgi:pyridoxine 5'-phosphate synthase PdxJ